MRWYKTLAQILLILSVIDFALAAPVVVQEHEARVSVVDVAKDGTATSPLRRDPAADRTNARPIPREQEPRQHNKRMPPPGSTPPPESTPPPPISQATYKPDPLNPPSPYSNTDSNVSPYQGQGPTDRPGPSYDGFQSTHITPLDGSPRIASSPGGSPSFGSWLPKDAHSSSSSSWSAGSGWESWSSSEESHPPSPGEVNQPPPAPLSTRPHPPPGAELSGEDSVKKAAMILMAMSRQGFRPRTYGSGAVDAAKEELLH